MMLRHCLALLSCLWMTAAHAGPAGDDPAALVKQAIERDWTAQRNDAGGYTALTSPIYPMPFGQGCVLHQLYFLDDLAGPSMGRMVAEDRYYAFATGEACQAIDPARFFGIEPGNDVSGLLDLAVRLKAGPQAGRDTLSRDAQARVPACFTPEAVAGTKVIRATSHRVGGVRGEAYRVVLACGSLRDGEEIHASGSRKDASVHWDIGSLTTVVPAAAD